MSPSPALVRRFPARADQIAGARHAVVAYGAEHGVADRDAMAIAVSEAVTNAVTHAYIEAAQPGEVEVIVQREPDNGILVSVTDTGRGMRPRSDSPGLGLGLPLMAALTQSFEVDDEPGGGTRLEMHFAVA